MNVYDLKSLELVVIEYERSMILKWRWWLRFFLIIDYSDNIYSKNIMIEMIGNIFEYYEDIEVFYKEKMVEFDEYRREYFVEKKEKDLMIDMIIEDLICLEEVMSFYLEKEIEDKEIMIELVCDDVEYLMELESLYKDN